MGYISNKGILAGPIQLNGSSSDDNGKIWIFAKERNGDVAAHIYGDRTFSSTSNKYIPIYAAMPLGISSGDISNYDNVVATVGWVRNNFSSSTGISGFNPDEYVKKETYNLLDGIVHNNVSRIETIENKILKIDLLENKITSLEGSFNSYKDNPYPNGVIFIAGTAAEVV